MPVRSLEAYLFERGVVGSASIDILQNCTLGIDVNHYVSRLLTSKREQYLDAIGGPPTSLRMYIDSDLDVFQENNVTPVFLFPGSLTSNQLDYQSYSTARADLLNSMGSQTGNPGSGKSPLASAIAQRNRAWAQWTNLLNQNKSTYIDQPLVPNEVFRHGAPIDLKRFQADLIHYFIEKDVRFQVAPYCSWMQLAYLYEVEYIDAIYGPTELLMLKNVPKFIVGMEFPNKEFRFVDSQRVLHELKCNLEDFIDICMAIGNDLQPKTLPPLQVYPSVQLFETALDMSVNGGTNYYTYLLTNPVKIDMSQEIESYQKGVSSLKYMPVLTESGRVELYTPDSHNPIATESESSKSSSPEPIPNDVHEFIQQRLPHEYNFYRSIGLIGNDLLTTLATGIYAEYAPLDGGSSESYKELVKKSIDIFKTKAVNLLTSPINRYYQIKQMKYISWFNPGNEVVSSGRILPTIFESVNRIAVCTKETEEFSISKLVNLLSGTKDLSRFITDKVLFPASVPADEKLTTPFDLLATNFLRFLTILGFYELDIDSKRLTPSKYGILLSELNELDVSPENLESVLILIVFIKLGVLSLSEETHPVTPPALSAATLRSYPKESQYILVLTRVLTMYQLSQKPVNYYGPIDKKLLIFRDHLDLVKKNLCQLFESVTVSSLVTGEFDRLSLDNDGWINSIVKLMPFKLSSPNTIMAMMWEFYLQKWLHNGHDKEDAMNLISVTFSAYKSVPKLEEEFRKSFELIEQVCTVYARMAELGLIKQSDLETYDNAYRFITETYSQ